MLLPCIVKLPFLECELSQPEALNLLCQLGGHGNP
jgi:hypothetical protein